MSEDLVVRTTVDFIRSSPKNLDLALQVEEAVPRLKADLIREFLKSVESRISTDEWQLEWSDAGLLKGSAWLVLRKVDWPTDAEPADQTGIWLGTDKTLWTQVYVGVYLSAELRNRIKSNEPETLPHLRRASEELLRGRGWRTHEFPEEGLGEWNGWATYRYLDEPVYDWSCAQFLRNSLDGNRKGEMVEQVVNRMESLRRGASALVEVVSQMT